jgi:hypothetical protein
MYGWTFGGETTTTVKEFIPTLRVGAKYIITFGASYWDPEEWEGYEGWSREESSLYFGEKQMISGEKFSPDEEMLNSRVRITSHAYPPSG